MLVTKARARLLERGLNIFQDLDGLRVRIADTHDLAFRIGCSGAGNVHVRSDPHCPTVTNHRFPRCAAGNVFALGAQREFLLADNCIESKDVEWSSLLAVANSECQQKAVQLHSMMRLLNSSDRFFD